MSESSVVFSTNSTVGRDESYQGKKSYVPPEVMIDGSFYEGDFFSFPFEEEDYFYEENIETKVLDSFDNESSHIENILKIDELWDDGSISPNRFIKFKTEGSSNELIGEVLKKDSV